MEWIGAGRGTASYDDALPADAVAPSLSYAVETGALNAAMPSELYVLDDLTPAPDSTPLLLWGAALLERDAFDGRADDAADDVCELSPQLMDERTGRELGSASAGRYMRCGVGGKAGDCSASTSSVGRSDSGVWCGGQRVNLKLGNGKIKRLCVLVCVFVCAFVCLCVFLFFLFCVCVCTFYLPGEVRGWRSSIARASDAGRPGCAARAADGGRGILLDTDHPGHLRGK